jgi:hypothetical protein
VPYGLEGYLRLFQMDSLLPLISPSAGWFVSHPSIFTSPMCEFHTVLVAQLKVNLRPLWAPAMKALSELSTRCDPVVWSAVFQDLRRLSEDQSLDYPQNGQKSPLPATETIFTRRSARGKILQPTRCALLFPAGRAIAFLGGRLSRYVVCCAELGPLLNSP